MLFFIAPDGADSGLLSHANFAYSLFLAGAFWQEKNNVMYILYFNQHSATSNTNDINYSKVTY